VIKRHHVSVVWLTAGLFHAIADERPETFRDIRQLLAGGDVLSPVHVRKALAAMDSGCVINGYGPTENTTFTCCCRVTPSSAFLDNVPIGKPITNTQVYILDTELRSTPDGELGEIFIGGDGLARGYLNQPELDRERFIPNPFSNDPDARLYRSGDWGRYLPSGDIEFGGRIDDQIKLSGFRVEPGEIEAAASRCAGVARTAVIAIESHTGDKSLVCFFVPMQGHEATEEQLSAHLKVSLPAYMVPNQYRRLGDIPLTSNGKADRRKLRELSSQTSPVPVPGLESAQEKDLPEVERSVLEILRDLLGRETISLDDDFFEVGGHSLAAARLFAKIEERFGVTLPLATVFRAPTARKLAPLIRDRADDWTSLVAIRSAGTRYPLFLVHAISGNVLNYKRLDAHLPSDQPIYAFQAAGLKENRVQAITIEETASAYLDSLRSVQPEGPYYIGGFSAGGIVAYEMAQQLNRAGEQVAIVILFDSSLARSVVASLRAHEYGHAAARALRIASWNLRYLARTNLRTFITQKVKNFRANLRILLCEMRNASQKSVDPANSSNFFTIEEAFLKALDSYIAEPYAGRAVLFRTADSDYYSSDMALAWSRLVQGGFSVVDVPGDHETMFLDPQIESLGRAITSYLDIGREESVWTHSDQCVQHVNAGSVHAGGR
jgi:aspartate racemase